MINNNRLFKTFHELLKINSPSSKEKNIAEYIKKRLNDIGIKSATDNTAAVTGANTGNVLARLKGDIKGKAILFSAHMDTIESTDNLEIVDEKGLIKSDGNSVLGADDKAGLAVILEMIKTVKEKNIKHLPIELVFTVSEEIGLFGAAALDFSTIKSNMAFCFDGGGPAGHLTMKSPTQEIISVEFGGKATHAGIEPEKGVNAIYAAAKAISAFPQGRIDNETTANIGTIKGGKATNVVADKAIFKAEVRSHNLNKLEDVVEKITKEVRKAAKSSGANVNIERNKSFVGFSLDKEEKIVKIAEQAMEKIGIKPTYTISGGGSDANVFNLKGLQTLTLSMGSQQAHAYQEFVEKEELVKTAELAVKIVEVTSRLGND